MFNGDLSQTNLNSAYQFNSFCPYIMNGGLYSKFSPNCIFCSSNNTLNLVNDGSFKQCNICKKQFKALILNTNQSSNNFSPYRLHR
jgi:hypothetical protein